MVCWITRDTLLIKRVGPEKASERAREQQANEQTLVGMTFISSCWIEFQKRKKDTFYKGRSRSYSNGYTWSPRVREIFPNRPNTSKISLPVVLWRWKMWSLIGTSTTFTPLKNVLEKGFVAMNFVFLPFHSSMETDTKLANWNFEVSLERGIFRS